MLQMASLTSCTTTDVTESGRHSRRSLKHVTSALAKMARGGYSRRARGGDWTLAGAGDWGRGFMYVVVMVAPGIDSNVNFFIDDENLKEGSKGLKCRQGGKQRVNVHEEGQMSECTREGGKQGQM